MDEIQVGDATRAGEARVSGGGSFCRDLFKPESDRLAFYNVMAAAPMVPFRASR